MDNDPLTEKIIGAAIEVHRPQYRLDGIGQDRVLVGATSSSLSTPEQDVVTETQRAGDRIDIRIDGGDPGVEGRQRGGHQEAGLR